MLNESQRRLYRHIAYTSFALMLLGAITFSLIPLVTGFTLEDYDLSRAYNPAQALEQPQGWEYSLRFAGMLALLVPIVVVPIAISHAILDLFIEADHALLRHGFRSLLNSSLIFGLIAFALFVYNVLFVRTLGQRIQILQAQQMTITIHYLTMLLATFGISVYVLRRLPHLRWLIGLISAGTLVGIAIIVWAINPEVAAFWRVVVLPIILALNASFFGVYLLRQGLSQPLDYSTDYD
jgi:hypothetical protein